MLVVKKRNVIIELRSVIDDAGEKELNIVKQKGHYFKRDHIEVLSYDERIEDDEEISNLISITRDKVNIKRSGAISMNQQFIPDRITECLYQHPLGNIHMEIQTESITHEPITDKKQGQLIITYNAKLNGQQTRKHQLTLTYSEGDLL